MSLNTEITDFILNRKNEIEATVLQSDSEYQAYSDKVEKLCTMLFDDLSPDNRKLLNKILDNLMTLQSISAEVTYREALKDGARMARELLGMAV